MGINLCSLLSRVKDPLPMDNLAGEVYHIPYQCSKKVYLGETQRHLETQVKEHRDARNKGHTSWSISGNTSIK